MKINRTYSIDMELWNRFSGYCDNLGYTYSAQVSSLIEGLLDEKAKKGKGQV